MNTNDFLSLVEKKKKKQLANILGVSESPTVSTSSNNGDHEFWDLVNQKQNEGISRFSVDDDIAPIRISYGDAKEEEEDSLLDFFDKGVFSDGYQFGDVTKTILGTAGDIGVGVLKGAGKVGEGLGKALGYGIAGVSDLFGADDYAQDVRDRLKGLNVVDDMASGADAYLDRYSVLGRTSQAITEGVGQVGVMIATGGAAGALGLGSAGASAVTYGMMGVSGFGHGTSEAFDGGATDAEAYTYGAISAAADVVTEMLFGGLGKGANALGFSKGLTSADDMLAKTVSSKISNQLGKNLVQFGIKAGAEGLEEVLAGGTQAIGKKLTYMSEEDIWDIVKDENLLEQFVVGAFTSGIAQTGDLVRANSEGRDFITGYDQNEQAVIQKETENRIAEREKDGAQLTNKEKSAIEAQVEKDLERGYISIDTIESALGGDTYKSYRQTVDSEDALQQEFDTLNKMKQGEMTGEQIDMRESLRQKLKDIQANSKRSQLQTQLRDEVFNLAKDSRLAESYNEKARRSQAFTADVTQYDAKQQAVIQKAIDSGILNNTNRTHEFVDMVAKISADKGVLFDFTNNAKLKESGFAVDGKSVNGYVTNDGITINIQSSKSLNSVVGHEITHVLEGTDFYAELQNAVFEYAKAKNDYQGRFDSLAKLYENIEGADVNAELTADLVGDYLFTDADFISNLSKTNRNVFQKIYDEIKYLLKVATAGSKEARELEKVKRAFEKAYNENVKRTVTDADIKTESSGKYSISETTDGQFVAVVDSDILSGIDTTSWDDSKKDAAKQAATDALKKFRDGIVVDGVTRKVNRTSRREYTRSKYTESLYDNSPDVFADKMRAAEVADDIVIAATNWNRDGGLKHPRNDNFVDFDHGKTLIMAGNSKYVAEVVVGITDTGDAVFYDVVDMVPTTFDIKKEESPTTATTQNAPGDIYGDSTADNVAQVELDVNTKYSLSMVEAVEPQSDLWHRTLTTEEAMARFPKLWDVAAEESEVRNPTQITSTVKSYRKVYDFLKAEGFNGTILDASSGLGYGTKAGIEEYGFNVEDIEPYPDKSYNPKYKDYSSLDKRYDAIISNAVLNVLPQDQRDALVVKMGELLNDGGRIFINVRGKDVDSLASNKNNVNISPMEWFVDSTGSYQKGFTKKELVAYLQDALGDGFTVEPTNMFGAVSAIVTKDGGVQYSLTADTNGRQLSGEQQEFFKNTKTVDENGNLKTLYHGSRSEAFTVFDLYEGAWLTTDPRYAEIYAGQWHSWRDDIAPIGEPRADLNGLEPDVYSDPDYRVYEMYANIQNPADIGELDIPLSDDKVRQLAQALGMRYTELKPLADTFMEEETYMLTRSREFIELAKERGFDGFKATEKGKETWCAFATEEQVKLTTNKTPTENHDIRYSLSDSQGRELTAEQQEYFKDSKAVDADGKLVRVYHGTRNADFTVFKRNATYFTDSKEMADSYSPNGDMHEGYVNITKPYEIDAAGERWSQIPIDEETANFLQEYGASVFKEGGKWRTSPADIVSAIEEAVDNGEVDYDGIIIRNVDDTGSYYKDKDTHLATDYITFNSNQFKNVDNTKPTADPDIRFSLSEAVEETKDLIAIHNMKASELSKAIALGGMPMPSIAIIKAQQSHEAYGDVSIIFPKDAIDPQASRDNKIYGGDAWTPTYPSIEYKASAKVQEAIEAKIDDLVPYDVQRGLGRVNLDYDNLSSDLNRNGGDMYQAYQYNRAMRYAFLVDNGFTGQLPMKEKNLDGSGRFDNSFIVNVVENLGVSEVETLANESIYDNDALISKLREMANENAKAKYAGDGKLLEALRKRPLYTEKNFGFAQADSIIRAAHNYVQNGFEQTVDYANAGEMIDNAVDETAYKEWVNNLFADIVEKEGIRNNADYYTPSGNRRSWEALHWENTLENVLKVMKAQNQTGEGFFGAASLFGIANKEYRSIAEMKADSDRLRTIPEEEYEALKDSFSNRLVEIADSIKDPSERNGFIAIDNAVEEIVDAVRTSKTKSSMLRNMQKWNKLVTAETVDNIVSLVTDISNMPTGYFEAKPQRAVGFEEVGVFVIPRNADVKLKQELLNRGYSIAEYDPDVEGDRQKVVNQFEEYKFSLSDASETPKTYGNYNVYGEDVSLETAQEAVAPVAESETTTAPQVEKPVGETVADMFPDDLAPVEMELESLQQRKEALEIRMQEAIAAEDAEAFNSVGAEYDAVMGRLAELEQETAEFEAERLDSLSEDSAPPTSEEWVERANVIPLTKKAAADIAREVRTQLGLSNKHMADVRNLIEEYSQSEFPSRDQLFADIKEKFGTYTETFTDETVKEAKSYLRTYGLFVPKSIQQEIADYANLMRRNRGRILFSKNGTSVDVLYHELNSLYPHLFPESIITPTDQFLQMVDVANMDNETKVEQDVSDETIWDVVDAVSRGVTEYQYSQKEKAANKYSREAFNSLMQDADQHVPPVDLDRILANRRKPVGTEEDVAPVAEIYDTQHKKGVAEGQQAMWEEPVEEKVTRKVLHERIVDGVKSEFEVKGFDFDEVLKKAKNLSTFATVDNIPQRVMEKALGYKEGQILSDITVNKVAQNETEGIKWLNSFTDRKNGLIAQISKQYNIKPGSKKSAAAQMYAEGFYVAENGDIIQYGDAELAKDFPNAKDRRNIKRLARDPRIRQIYDETLTLINESRKRNAYPEIPRLDNYFLHFRAMDDTFSRLGLPFNPNDIRAKDLPTDLNGVTADLKPGQPYFASAMHRTGKRTSFDLLGGLEKYLNSAKNQIYHIDDIQTLRALRNYIADTYGQANGLEGLDALTEEEAQERIEQVYGSHLSTFAKFLNEEANVLAGKTALIDRGLEGIIGRRGITFLNTINQQVGKNMVGFNVSSSLTNFLPVAQTFAKTNKFVFLKAFAQTVSNKVGSIFGKNDGFAESSPVIIRRKGAESFYRTPWQKVGDTGYFLMSAVDDISTELIARTKYNELTRKGMDSQQAHYETDKWVSRLMGDRSLGQQPQLYNSKMLGLVTKFQLEVRNQLDAQFYDTIQEANVSTENIQNRLARNAAKAAQIGSTFFQLAVVQHLFGKAFESVAGYNPAFDIIDVLIKTFGWDDDEEDEDTVLDNVEEGFLALLEDLPYTSTFTGGRIPLESALPIELFVTGKDKYGNEKSRWETLGEAAPYYLLPGGYGQIKKTVAGLSMFDEDHPVAGSYTDSGNLRFPVDDTFGNRLQAGLFGQWASENAGYYFDNEIAPLKPNQVQEYIDVEMPIKDYWAYRKGLSGLDTLEEQANYINGLDLPTWKKNILINNIADRKEPIDMSDYSEYGSLAEFDFANKYPEKYDFFQGIGISYEDYANADKDVKDVYNWAFENPEKYLVSRAVTSDLIGYRQYTGYLNDIRADKDSNGKSISGSAKEKKIAYINGLDIDYGAKLILIKSEYPAEDAYNYEIVEYLNGRSDISYEDEITILKELGFVVLGDGTVLWD